MKVQAILTTDTSGSMEGKKLEDAKRAQKEFAGELPDGSSAGLVTFGGSLLANFIGKARPIQELTEDTSRIRDSLKGLSAGGGTPLYAGLQTSYEQLKGREGKRVIVLATDGRPTIGPAGEEIVQLGQKVKSGGIRLITVAIGRGADKDLLKRLASSPEDFHVAEFSGQLPELYEEIVAGLTPVSKEG